MSAQPLDFALRYGLVVGLVGLLIGTLSGFTEWYTDNLPERRLGLLGIYLIICGVIIRSVQYWVSLLDVLYGNTRSVATRSLRTQDSLVPVPNFGLAPRLNMNRQLPGISRALRDRKDGANPVLKVALIYRNFAAGVRARGFFEKLASALDTMLEEEM